MKISIFQDNVVIITGASSGIGRELAIQLANQGATLVVAARDIERLENVSAQCKNSSDKVLVVKTDVGKASDCENLIKSTNKEYGRIDTLINNAGFAMRAAFEELPDLTLLENIMQVNYLGGVYCTYYALPYLKKTGGRIVGISSLAGKTGVPLMSGYAASKHAMVGFFDSLRMEVEEDGMSVTMIYPGFVETEIAKRAIGPDGQSFGGNKKPRAGLMTAKTCAQLIIKATATRRRKLVMTTQAKTGQWIKLIAPSLVDRIARKAMAKSH
ncbi:SDR family oxidoreductase [candidate division KSB1 bacterium]|nr:SDR family oxidoreductase [candidate division KSB1 bacterium]